MAARERLSADELSLARVTHPCLKSVSDEAVRLAARQPPLWEYRLYFQALADFIARETAAAAGDRSPARVDSEADYAAQGLDVLDWIQDRHQEYLDLAKSIDRLVNSELQVAFEPGRSIDELCDARVLHADCRRIFRAKNDANDFGRPIRLHRHQDQAIGSRDSRERRHRRHDRAVLTRASDSSAGRHASG
jgi:hypothetical protein